MPNGGANDAENRGQSIRGAKEAGASGSDRHGSEIARRASEIDWRQQERVGGADSSWDFADIPEEADPGGICTRLLTAKVEALSETKARYFIVLQRKQEYEERIQRLEEEITEIRSQVEELINIASDEAE